MANETLHELLVGNKAGILARWQQKTLGSYAPDATAFFKRERNQFANPVGHAVREGTRTLLDVLLDGFDADRACAPLNEIVKIRAIQDFTPAQALGFVFSLKDAVREEIPGELGDPRLQDAWVEFCRQVDQLALFAFDIYTRCREKVCELRVNEIKRRVGRVMDRLNQEDADGVEPKSQ